MNKTAKIVAFVAIGLLVASVASYFAIKSAVEKIINDPETRSEIAKVVEDGLRNIIIRPKITIQSLQLSSLSTVNIGQSTLSASGRTILTGVGQAHCSLIRLILRGSCKGNLTLDFGNDGSLHLNAVITRALLSQDNNTSTPINVSGNLTNLNTSVLAAKKSAAKSAIDVVGGRISGKLNVSVIAGSTLSVKGRFNGDLKGMSLGATVMGQTRKTNLDIPLDISFDDKRLSFDTPLRANLLGIAIEYAGSMKFEREPVWFGNVRAKGPALLQAFVPTIFQCKTKPGNPVNFRMTGPLSNPQCR